MQRLAYRLSVFVTSLLVALLSPVMARSASASDIVVEPPTLVITVAQGMTATTGFTISNVGVNALDVAIQTAVPVEVPPTLVFPSEKVDPALQNRVQAADDSFLPFLVYLEDQADLESAYAIQDWQARGQAVVQALQRTAESSQPPLIEWLDAQMQQGTVADYRPYTIVNAVWVSGKVTVLDSLAADPKIAYIEAVSSSDLPEPLPTAAVNPQATEWNLTKIGAPSVWSEFGVRGEGVVVAAIDTGALSTHPALLGAYRGSTTGSHDYNWFDATDTYPTQPGDSHGHGTHVTGIMVGQDGVGNQIGVAPGALWIAARGCSSSTCESADLLAAAEWILAPFPIGSSPAQGDPAMRPHIVNASWGGDGGDLWYQAAVLAWRAADIFPAFASGNSGPGTSSILSPGDYAESFASGATDASDVVASFSGRGPSLITTETKPDLSAPGVSIRSSWKDGGYGVLNGTSMASPHTAACAALLRSLVPGLTVSQLEALMTATAVDLSTPGPDSVYGYGRLDCHAAATAAVSQQWISVSPRVTQINGNGSIYLTLLADAETNSIAVGTYRSSIIVREIDQPDSAVTVPLQIEIVPAYQAPVAQFSADPVRGEAPLSVTFSDQSTGEITVWLWDFGDGQSSGERNPVHAYANTGVYSVTLQVTGPGGNDEYVADDAIHVDPPAQVTSVTPQVGLAGSSADLTITVAHIDLTQGSWTADLGSGIAVKSTQVVSPTTALVSIDIDQTASPGSRPVLLRQGDAVIRKDDAFTVTAPEVQARFPQSVTAPIGSQVSIPVQIADQGQGQPVIAFEFDARFDPAVLTPMHLSSDGTLSDGWTLVGNDSQAGHWQVVAFGSQALLGDGALLHLVFNVEGPAGDLSELDLQEFVFNEGNPSAVTTAGQFVAAAATISGRVIYGPDGRSVPDAVVDLSGPAPASVTTLDDGRYALQVSEQGSYSVQIDRAAEVLGLSALDAAWIAQCLADVRDDADCPLQLADVSGDGGVSAYDAALIARYLAGMSEPSTRLGQWLFAPQSRSYPSIADEYVNQDFVASLVGDLTGNALNPPPASPTDEGESDVTLSLPTLDIEPGERVTVELTMVQNDDTELLAYQLTLGFDSAQFTLLDVNPAGSPADSWFVVHQNEEPGLVEVVGYGVAGLDGNGPILSLEFEIASEATLPIPLTIVSAQLNEDQLEPSLRHGLLTPVGSNQRVFLPYVAAR